METIPVAPPRASIDTSRIFDTSIDPLVRLRIIEAGEFEDIVCEWAVGYLMQYENYKSVAQIGGSKDSGRDIVAYLDNSMQSFDIFQCKRYKDPLAPSGYMSEFGKLCYYTMIGKYNRPRKYFIVASNGIGQDLRDLVEHPSKINRELIDTWDKYCAGKRKILSSGLPLSAELKVYIEQFDFSIVSEISPATLIEQFAKTRWYKYHFGGGLKQRPKVNKPQEDIEDEELRMQYVDQLLQVYSKHENTSINNIEILKLKKNLHQHFKRQRECFHNAQALKRFARDELISDDAYDDVKNQVLHGVIATCQIEYDTDLKRVDETVGRSQILPINSTELGAINILEKSGICHELVNDEELQWIYDSE
ncbi:ABC-three component system protein [Paenibacillus sp. NPDC058174]|uniref:ABC-three component system protein n=1 Tax=Paenibacillus sp. NPDC058174 TaxID=3346366 RepID=UPI0036D9CFA0